MLAGFAGLLLILGSVVFVGNRVLNRYSAATQRVLQHELRTVAACEQLADTTDRIAAALPNAVAGSQAAIASIDRDTNQANASIQAQMSASTDASTLRSIQDLRSSWGQFQSDYERLLTSRGAQNPPAPLSLQTALAQARQLRAAAHAVAQQKIADVRSAHGELHTMATTARWAMDALAVFGGFIAVGFGLLMGRMVLRPLNALTHSAREIQEGKLELQVPVESRDELGRLAIAFNDMATGLRQSRRLNDELILRTKATTQIAVDSLPDAVLLINREGRVEIANRTAIRLFAAAPDLPVSSLHQRQIEQVHAEVIRTGEPAQPTGYEGAVRIVDEGRERFFLASGVPIIDGRSQPIGVTVILNDVTELHRLDEMKNGLLSMVAHEMKTPLTSMRMILHLVAEQRVGPLDEKQQELLSAASEESDRLHLILENPLDMERIESGRVLMDMRPVPAGDLAGATVEGMRGAFAERDIAVEYEVPSDAPQVLADPTRIAHVLANLLNNALRHTPHGGVVRVTSRVEPDFVEFVVSDTGSGIPPQYLHRIFEKFFRVPGQNSEGGSGLGLAIVKDIVEAHGGRIVAESVEGRGSTFRFTLRRATAGRKEIDHGTPATSHD